MDKEKKKAEKDMEFYIRRQIMYQKIHMVLIFALLGVLIVFSIYFVNFARKAKVFMNETKVTLEQANETMKTATVFLELATEKIDNLDMKGINSAIGKTDELIGNVDEAMEKTNDVLATIDDAAQKTESMVDSVQNFSDKLDGLKGKIDTVGNWLSKIR